MKESVREGWGMRLRGEQSEAAAHTGIGGRRGGAHRVVVITDHVANRDRALRDRRGDGLGIDDVVARVDGANLRKGDAHILGARRVGRLCDHSAVVVAILEVEGLRAEESSVR